MRVSKIEKAMNVNRKELMRFSTSLLFIIAIMLFTTVRVDNSEHGVLLVVAAMIGGYMAMNIGANDVANNVGPAVGSHAITLFGAIAIAALFEAGGALIAGGDVVGTIKNGIINPELIGNSDTFIWLMIAALLAAAIWLNIATSIGAPVSTTHSIVGGVLGAGVAAGGSDMAVKAPTTANAASPRGTKMHLRSRIARIEEVPSARCRWRDARNPVQRDGGRGVLECEFRRCACPL